MKLHEIQTACSNLASQLEAGVPVSSALLRNARLQKKYESMWLNIAAGLTRGTNLSEGLQDVWPQSFISAIKSGEYTGNISNVFRQIEETIAIQLDVKSQIKKIAWPLGIITAALGVNIFFMIWVLPAMIESLDFDPDKAMGFASTVNSISQFLVAATSDFYGNIMILGGLLGLGYLVFFTPVATKMVMPLLFKIPLFKSALSSLYFGIWSKYVAFLSKTGSIPIKEQMTIPMDVMPEYFHKGVKMAANDAAQYGLEDAVNQDKLPEDDPRQEWPFLLSNSFSIANMTGKLDVELDRVTNSLIEEGKKTLVRIIKTGNIFALLIAAVFVMTPLIAYYLMFAAALQEAMGQM